MSETLLAPASLYSPEYWLDPEVHNLGIKEKWALLPKLAGKRTVINLDEPPHQAIAELDSLGNDLFHVKYECLVLRLSSYRIAVNLFNQFVAPW